MEKIKLSKRQADLIEERMRSAVDEGDWPITIKTGRVRCINLVGGLCGPKKTNQEYECELLENKSGKCRKKDCPLIGWK